MIATLAALLLSSAHPAYCFVTSVHDGDTFRCRPSPALAQQIGRSTSEDLRVRLLLIDAPELAQGSPGIAAKRVLSGLLRPGSPVALTTDRRAWDQYGRLLAYVRSGATDVNERMVATGYAVPLVYKPNTAELPAIQRAASEAKKGKRGLWKTWGFPCSPHDFRHRKCGDL